MLVAGSYALVDKIKEENFIIFNLSSYLEGYQRLRLQPPMSVYNPEEQIFDVNYANFLLNDNNAFHDLMQIILNLYDGKRIYIIYNIDDEYNDLIAESLLKFIQQRYGYNYCIVQSYEDLDFIISNNTISNFTINGIYNLDLDKKRYIENNIKEFEHHGIKSIPKGHLF